jgi:DNA-directed RNA polymerase specialized sigma24 family protein
LRAENRHPSLADESDPDGTWALLPDQSTQGDEARWRTLRFAVGALPTTQRRPIELAFFRGLGHSEIAEVLSWPIGTVKTRIRLGMARLRREWTAPDEAGKSEPLQTDVSRGGGHDSAPRRH